MHFRDLSIQKGSNTTSQLLMHLAQTLQLHQLEISSLTLQELVVFPALYHLAPIQDVNYVGVLDGAEPMRHDDRGPTPSRSVERRLHDLFGLRVERRGCLVEQQDLRVSDESPGDGDTLLLTAG